ncbi:hypothetical protein LCGC14_1509140 [marine sediment metagenome]|uniref:Uncharacterized protein n=1 Tax=marine sediment metagenome TaxID=412755 RepID=A0A0F9LHA2_9ZZZZ
MVSGNTFFKMVIVDTINCGVGCKVLAAVTGIAIAFIIIGLIELFSKKKKELP